MKTEHKTQAKKNRKGGFRPTALLTNFGIFFLRKGKKMSTTFQKQESKQAMRVVMALAISQVASLPVIVGLCCNWSHHATIRAETATFERIEPALKYCHWSHHATTRAYNDTFERIESALEYCLSGVNQRVVAVHGGFLPFNFNIMAHTFNFYTFPPS